MPRDDPFTPGQTPVAPDIVTNPPSAVLANVMNTLIDCTRWPLRLYHIFSSRLSRGRVELVGRLNRLRLNSIHGGNDCFCQSIVHVQVTRSGQL